MSSFSSIKFFKTITEVLFLIKLALLKCLGDFIENLTEDFLWFLIEEEFFSLLLLSLILSLLLSLILSFNNLLGDLKAILTLFKLLLSLS